MQTMARHCAVVLGGGMAGLLAARVLTDEYARVILVERDRFPRGSEHRRGIPHGHHAHALLPRGRQVMEDLLPGLTAQLMASGALAGDVLGNIRWYLNGQRLSRTSTGLLALSASRPLIEGAIRERVLALRNVTTLDGYDIVGLRSSPDRRRITGVRATSPHRDGDRVVSADLVVDATGRGSRSPRWLAELGYPTLELDRVTVGLTYASRVFRTPPQFFGDDIAVVTPRYPGKLRSGVMQRIEGDRVIVTLAGLLGERPPLELEGFARYAASLAAPDIHEAVRSSRPIAEPAAFRFPTYVRRRYERLTDVPAGLFVIGDAMCAFNPVYAQGMSVAALGAAVLRDEVRRGGEPDGPRFYAAMSRMLDAPWTLAVGADLAVAGVEGPPMPRSSLSHEYLAALQRRAVEDADVAAAFIRVTSLVDEPSTLSPTCATSSARSGRQPVERAEGADQP